MELSQDGEDWTRRRIAEWAECETTVTSGCAEAGLQGLEGIYRWTWIDVLKYFYWWQGKVRVFLWNWSKIERIKVLWRRCKLWGLNQKSEQKFKYIEQAVLLQSTHHSFLCSVGALLLEKGGAKDNYINWSENGCHCKQDEHEPKICETVFFHWRYGYLQCSELISS